MGLKQKSLLRLGLKRKPYWQSKTTIINKRFVHYKIRDERTRLIYYYPKTDTFKIIPVKPTTLEDLGLERTEYGRIIQRRWLE